MTVGVVTMHSINSEEQKKLLLTNDYLNFQNCPYIHIRSKSCHVQIDYACISLSLVTSVEKKMSTETRAFEAEVSQLFDLVTHSLYSNKEVFLRELISNASDALDKLRFEGLSSPEIKPEDPKIWIEIHPEQRQVIIRDNGIGMSRDEAIAHLGTIAKSGTSEFLKKIAVDKENAHHLIGQFGVGFYSAFIVADKVIVNSRRADLPEDQAVSWECLGKGEYQVQTTTKKEPGTEVILHLKPEEDEFLQSFRIKSLIKKYSDHIPFPILMEKEPKPSEKEEEKDEAQPETPELEVVNQANALWVMPRDKIKDEEYKNFYKHVAHDFEEPLLWSHNKVEGKLEYTSLLYIPSRAPFGLWNRDQQHGLKLYVQRVFIMDNAEKLLPLYLRFVRGVVDSNDLPLNVSRELLQSHHVVESIRSGCTRRVLDMLEKLAKEETEQYQKFWNEMGQVLKEGVGEDFAHKDRIAKLLRFASTHGNTPDQTVSLEDYVGRMKEGQDKIYYLVGESFNAVKNSPHLEIFRKKGIEVLLLFDRIDEWLVAYLNEFEGKSLQSVAKGDLDIGKLEEEKPEEEVKKQEEAFEKVLKHLKEVLEEKTEEVRLTDRLTDSPACLVASQEGLSRHLQQMLKEAGQAVPENKPVLELNPEHSLVQQLKTEADEDRFKDMAHVLFDSALLAEGGHLVDPAAFVRRVNRFLTGG